MYGKQFWVPLFTQAPAPLHVWAKVEMLPLHTAAAHTVPDDYGGQVRLPLQKPLG